MAEVDREDILCADGVRKDYVLGPRLVRVLKGVSFTVRRGEFVAVTGAIVALR